MTSFSAGTNAGVYLHDLVSDCPVAVNCRHYRRIVLEHSVRRRISEAAERMTQSAERLDLGGVLHLMETEVNEVRLVKRRLREEAA